MMRGQTGRHRNRAAWRAVLGLALPGLGATCVLAQVPTQSPFDSAPQPPAEAAQPPPPMPVPAQATTPSVPSPAVPPPGTSREAQLEARVRQLEAMVNRLSTQINPASPAGARPATGAGAAVGAGGSTGPDTSGLPGTGTPGAGTGTPDTGSPATAAAPSASGGPSAPGQSFPPNPPPSARFNQPATLDNIKASTKFGPGFEIRTVDDEYIFQFHNLTQLDYRGYQQGGQSNVRDTFVFPRQWFMFSGRLTKPFGYFVSLAHGFDSVSVLDAFVDIDYDPRLRFRLGRFKTPFTYEFFVEPIQGLTIPERSLFFNNFALNRDMGVMAFGRLMDQKLDYGVGIFNGVRNGVIDLDNSKAVAAYTNLRPFADWEDSLLENFNVGGSVWAGNQNHSPIPQTFRTVVPTAGNSILGVPFLALNNNVRENGPNAFWDLHVAWFYRQLAVIGEWGSGFNDYSLTNTVTGRHQLGVQSFYVQASYLLTGETRSSIGIVKPNQPFDIRQGKFGIGAWEPYFRYEYMDINRQVFTQGLADQNLWANRLFATHVGVNWHLTQYVKMYFDWNHDEFNNPVVFAPNRRQKTSDLFLVRFQIYF